MSKILLDEIQNCRNAENESRIIVNKEHVMKVLLINGSRHKAGFVFTALDLHNLYSIFHAKKKKTKDDESSISVSKKYRRGIMSNLCKNCSSKTRDLYCAHCGQSTSTKRIDWAFCFKEFIFNNLTLHKGLLYTIKSLIVNPKKMVEDYLSGKRIGYTGAVQFFLFVLILKGVIALIVGDAHATEPGKVMINGISADIDLKQYLKPMVIIFTSISSLGNYLVYKSKKYNLAEHFFLNFYIIGMCFLLTLVYNIITLYKFPDDKTFIMLLLILSYYIRIFYDKKIRVVDFLKGIWCLTLNLIFAAILIIIGAVIYMYQHNLLDDAVKVSINSGIKHIFLS